MIIPWQQLEKETLINIVESFILREGTDYGIEELSLEEKKNNLLAKIYDGSAIIFWSELHETIDIKNRNDFLK
ncbi:hypothetical protein EV697_10673 [Bisgaardia hudsonensis]|uniref:Uncharacterized protein n=1 Tax=Bisgaardia hudsonensis TaxID=109472 RepID=A0A4R2MWU3_9PAST|nr:YheU family protein [Bisgaardia hudsonensis]QLB13798.1 hypothetical protein A6A11_09350 [Bisgaardia hudsonensis]TCP11719.1 hypothetical protein EV697_10673 [Bisgaardia hudsonensis]